MKVAAGVRLAIAVTKVAEVNFIASTYKFWFIVNLHTYEQAYNKIEYPYKLRLFFLRKNKLFHAHMSKTIHRPSLGQLMSLFNLPKYYHFLSLFI